MRLEGLTGLESHEGRLFLAGPGHISLSTPLPVLRTASLPSQAGPLCSSLSPQSLLGAQTSSLTEVALLGPVSAFPF